MFDLLILKFFHFLSDIISNTNDTKKIEYKGRITCILLVNRLATSNKADDKLIILMLFFNIAANEKPLSMEILILCEIVIYTTNKITMS